MKVNIIFTNVATVLLDLARKHTTANEMVNWFNEAVGAIITRRPDACMVRANIDLVAGWKQLIDPALVPKPVKLVDVLGNVSGRGIRIAERTALDAAHPQWRTDTPSTTIKNVVLDERTPIAFDVWPPAAAGAQLEVLYQGIPAPLAVADINTADIPVGDEFAPMLVDWMLARAFAKDSAQPENLTLSNKHQALFDAAIGGKTAVDGALSATAAQD